MFKISVKASTFPVASRWRSNYNEIFVFRCVQVLDSYRTCEVWGRSDIVWLSYNNFYSHGETSKFVMPPWTRPLTKTLDLRNLKSQRPLG